MRASPRIPRKGPPEFPEPRPPGISRTPCAGCHLPEATGPPEWRCHLKGGDPGSRGWSRELRHGIESSRDDAGDLSSSFFVQPSIFLPHRSNVQWMRKSGCMSLKMCWEGRRFKFKAKARCISSHMFPQNRCLEIPLLLACFERGFCESVRKRFEPECKM